MIENYDGVMPRRGRHPIFPHVTGTGNGMPAARYYQWSPKQICHCGFIAADISSHLTRTGHGHVLAD